MASEEQNENVKAYLEIMAQIKQAEKERKERTRLRAKAVRLLNRKKRLEQQLKDTAKEFDKILYDDNVFPHFARRKFTEKHGL